MSFKSRAVRNLVELHREEVLRFLEVWKSFEHAGFPMPEAHGDANYASPERLLEHVGSAACSELHWVCEKSKLPSAVLKASDFDAILAAYDEQLAGLSDDDLSKVHGTNWGFSLVTEAMLEHAVIHPMRHRLQLERLLQGRD